jgi:chromosomal replication initiation ATPase DnaA
LASSAAAGNQPVSSSELLTARHAVPAVMSAQHSTMNVIIDLVAEAYRVSPQAIRSRLRTPEVAEARQVCYWIASRLGWSSSLIGRVMDRHHGAIIHGVKAINNYRDISTDSTTLINHLWIKIEDRLDARSLDCSQL